MSADQEFLTMLTSAIDKAIRSKLEKIGIRIQERALDMIDEMNIKDTGKFKRGIDNGGYRISHKGNQYTLSLVAAAKHSPFVLGGKVASWTPIAPIKAWVERKHLGWMDKQGHPMTTEDMARAIIFKIKRKGIPERNVLQMSVKELKKWIDAEIGNLSIDVQSSFMQLGAVE